MHGRKFSIRGDFNGNIISKREMFYLIVWDRKINVISAELSAHEALKKEHSCEPACMSVENIRNPPTR